MTAHFDLASLEFNLNAALSSFPSVVHSREDGVDLWEDIQWQLFQLNQTETELEKEINFIFLLLCIVLQMYSVFISYYLVIFTKKNMRPLNSTLSFISTQIGMSSYRN